MTLHRRYRRGGFTLVELLVVIAIIGTLVGLLLPAVNAARDSARRSECQNKLKQVALAAINFHEANRAFPANNTGTPNVAGSNVLLKGEGTSNVASATNKSYGTHVFLLPFLEESAVFDRIDFSVSPVHTNNATLRATLIPAFACPSDPNAMFLDAVFRVASPGGFTCNQIGGVCGDTTGGDSGLGSGQFRGQFCSYPGSGGDGYENNHTGFCGTTGYASFGCGSAGDGPAVNTRSGYAGTSGTNPERYRGIFCGRPANNNGYIGSNGAPRLPRQTAASIEDGLSSTILFGHESTNSSWQNSGAFYSPWNVRVTSTPIYMGQSCAKQRASWGGPAASQCYNYNGGELWGFDSHHGADSPVAMADGSVRWLAETIDQKAYNAMGSKAGAATAGFAPEARPQAD